MDKACYVASVTHQEYKICADICKSQTRGLTSQLQEPWEPREADMAAKPWRTEVSFQYFTLRALVSLRPSGSWCLSLFLFQLAVTQELISVPVSFDWIFAYLYDIQVVAEPDIQQQCEIFVVEVFFSIFPGGYRALGLGGRAGGYGTPGAFGTSDISAAEPLTCLSMLCLLTPLFGFGRCRSGHWVGNWTHKWTGPGFGPGSETW